MKALTVLIDMDDTLEGLCPEWVKYLNNKHGTSVKHSDITDWDMTKAFPSLERKLVYAPLVDPALWENVKPLPGAVEKVQQLINDGHKVVIVTASHQDTVSPKLNSVLFRYFPFLTYKDVIISSQKQLIKGDVLVDDAPHNLVNGTYKGILMNAYHNAKYDAEANGFVRANDWEDVYKIICQMAKE